MCGPSFFQFRRCCRLVSTRAPSESPPHSQHCQLEGGDLERESWRECQPTPCCSWLVAFRQCPPFFRQFPPLFREFPPLFREFPPLFWQFPALFLRYNFTSNWPQIALLECSAADVLTQCVEQSWIFHEAAKVKKMICQSL